MLDPKKLEEVIQSVTQALPSGLNAMGSDIEKNIKTALKSVLTKLDLVTREEFDVQTQVLQRTRAKLDELESKLAAFEQAQQSHQQANDSIDK